MTANLYDILVCPICKSKLKLNEKKNELICKNDGIAFPIKSGIPVMIESEARTLLTEERLSK